MAGAFIEDESQIVLGNGLRWNGMRSPVGAQMPPANVGWGLNMCPTTSVGAEAARSFISHQQHAELTKRLCHVGEQPMQGPSSPNSELHIFCPTQGREQRTGGKFVSSGRNLAASQRWARRQSPARSPSKFELAAVAALCRPGTAASPPRYRATQTCEFPPAISFVPGKQLSCGTPSGLGGRCAAVCNTPISPIRRPDRRTNKEPPPHTSLPEKRLPMQPHLLPPSAVPSSQQQWGAKQPAGHDGGFSYGKSCDAAAMDGDGPYWQMSNPPTGSTELFPWQGQPPGSACTHEGPSVRLEFSGTRVTAGTHAGKAAPYFTDVSQPLGSNISIENNVANRRQGYFSTGYRSIEPMLMNGQADNCIQVKNKETQELPDDSAAEVVTVQRTDRFWKLMEILVGLQRGPTSLLSSSVTFDSVVLPGGELQYALIEQGSFGRVFVGSHEGRKVAIKVPVESMLRNDAAGVVERTLNEWQILSMCPHPNVVRLVGGIVHGPFDVWLVTQLANGSDLHSRKYSRDPLVQRVITPENGLYMCRQLAAVVAYLHSPIPGRKPVVVHRDIKPENVLIADDWTIQLCDFGDAEASADGRVSRISGATWFYAPAELLRCSPVECMSSKTGGQLPSFNEKWDIWSMGCVFQEMFGLFNPMQVHISSRDSPNVIYQKLKAKAIAGALIPDIAKEIQGIARTIISKCLNPDPESRPSAAEVLDMWNANDDEILKDIILEKSGSWRNVKDDGTYASSYLQRCTGFASDQQLFASSSALPNTLSAFPHVTTGTEMCRGDAEHGQMRPAVGEGFSNSASGLLPSDQPNEYSWGTRAGPAKLQMCTPLSRLAVMKQGTKCVHAQNVPPASWEEYTGTALCTHVDAPLAGFSFKNHTSSPQFF